MLIGSAAIWKCLCDCEDAMNPAQPSLLLARSRNIYDSRQQQNHKGHAMVTSLGDVWVHVLGKLIQ